DAENPDTRASLARARGMKAEKEGRDEEAAEHYRESIKIYESMPVGPSSLNNGAIGYSNLYHVTGDQQNAIKSIALLEKALELKPRDTIILRNLAQAILNKGLGS